MHRVVSIKTTTHIGLVEWTKDVCDGQDSCKTCLCPLIVKYGDPYPECDREKDFNVAAECPNGEFISDSLKSEVNGDKISLKLLSLQCQPKGKNAQISLLI